MAVAVVKYVVGLASADKTMGLGMSTGQTLQTLQDTKFVHGRVVGGRQRAISAYDRCCESGTGDRTALQTLRE